MKNNPVCPNCEQDSLIVSSIVMLALFQNSDRDKAFEFDIECQSCGFKEPAIISADSAIQSFYDQPFKEDCIISDENNNMLKCSDGIF